MPPARRCSAKPSGGRGTARPALEPLEARAVPSITLPTPGTPGPVTMTGTAGDDGFLMRLKGGYPDFFQFSDDGGATFQTAALADVTAVSVGGLGGNDTLTVDESNGLVAKKSGPDLIVAFDG